MVSNTFFDINCHYFQSINAILMVRHFSRVAFSLNLMKLLNEIKNYFLRYVPSTYSSLQHDTSANFNQRKSLIEDDKNIHC